MDIEELRKHQRWKQAEAEERRRRLRIWLHFIVIVLGTVVFMLVVHRVAR